MLTGSNLIFSSINAANGTWRNISNWVAFSVHLQNVEGHVWIEISNDPNVLTSGANTIGVPANPVLGQFTPTADMHLNGVSAPTTYFVKTTFVTKGGESLPSNEATLAVSAGNLLTVAAPAADAAGIATGWNVYISTVTNKEVIQNLQSNTVIAPLSFRQTFTLSTLMTNGIGVPVADTSGSPATGVNVTSPDIIAAAAAQAEEDQLIYNSGTKQAVWTPSALVYNFIRVVKDSTTQTLKTQAFLFGQQG